MSRILTQLAFSIVLAGVFYGVGYYRCWVVSKINLEAAIASQKDSDKEALIALAKQAPEREVRYVKSIQVVKEAKDITNCLGTILPADILHQLRTD